MRPICVHCRAAVVTRPRGLCWSCYYTPGVRDRHPVTSKYHRRGEGHVENGAPTPAPTAALPGTPEKLLVMAERVRLGQSPWHPGDARRSAD